MMRCGIPSGRPLGFLVTTGSSPKKADGGAKGIFHVCLMWALSSDIERKISPVMSHKTSHRDVGVQGPEIPQPVPRDGLELGKVARSEVQDVSGEGQAEGVHPEGQNRRGHLPGKGRPGRPDVVQGEGWSPVRSFREVGARRHFEVGHKEAEPKDGPGYDGVSGRRPVLDEPDRAPIHPSIRKKGEVAAKVREEDRAVSFREGDVDTTADHIVGETRRRGPLKAATPVLWSVAASDVVRRKQGVSSDPRSTNGSRSLTDREISSATIPGGHLAVKGEAFTEGAKPVRGLSLPLEWPSSSEQGDEERPRSEVPLHREVIVRPERKYSPEAFSPSRKGDWGVQADEGPPEEAYIEVGHVESMQEGGVGIEHRDQNEGLRAEDSRTSGRVQLGRVAEGKIYQRLGESELVPMSSGREEREDGGGKGDISTGPDRGTFIGRPDLGTSTLSSPKSDREGEAGSILTRLRTSIGLSATPDGDMDAEPVLWSFNVVRRKQGVFSRDGSRSLRDLEVSSGAIPGGRLAVKGEAFAEEVSLPSKWPSSSKQGDEVIVRPLKGHFPAKEGDMGVRVDGGSGVGKDSISSDRGAFIGRSDLEGIALRDCLGPEVVSEGKTQIGTSPGDGPSGGSSPLEEDAVSKGLFWMNDRTTWPAAEPRPGKVVGPKTGFDFPSGGPGRGSIRPVESRPKDRPGIAPDHVRRRERQVKGEQGSSAQRDEAPGRAISERDIGPRATPKEPYPLRPAVRPSTPYKREAERAYERAFGIEGGGITAAPEGRASGTQDLPAGDVRFLAAKIEEISARAARTDLPSGRIRVIFRTSVEGAGQVHVEVSREPTGAVAVFVRVQDQGLRDELLKASPQIRQALAEGGVQLARLEVEAEDHPVGWEGPIGDEGPSRRGYYHRFKRKSREDRGWTG